MEYVLALVAAFLFALATVLQQKAAVAESDEDALKANFLLKLARRPVWLAGIVADGVGSILQAWALGIGRLVVVQPLLSAAVVFALPLGKRILGIRYGRRELLAAAGVGIGLGAFLVLSNPAEGKDDAPLHEWLIAGAVIIGAVVGLGAIGIRARPAIKAATFGAASGLLWGLASSLTKATVDQLDEGIFHVLTEWHFYAMVGAGLSGTAIQQIALQSGALAPAVATTMTFEPLSGVALGVLLLDETIHEDTIGVVLSILALGVMVAGIAYLAIVQQAQEPADEPASPVTGPEEARAGP